MVGHSSGGEKAMIENIKLQLAICKLIENRIELPEMGKLGRREHPLRLLAGEILAEVVEYQQEPDVYGLPMDEDVEEEWTKWDPEFEEPTNDRKWRE